MNQNLGIFIFVGAIVIVLILSFSVRVVLEKRRKASAQERVQAVLDQLQHLQDVYIKDKDVKLAYAYSNADMCRNASDKAKEVAKNVAKAAVRTALTGRASYKGSDIESSDFVIGYGKQTYYFFQALSTTNAQQLTLCEKGFFTIKKEEIKSITVKDKKSPIITMDLQNGVRIGFQLKDTIINEYSYKEENKVFLDFMKTEAFSFDK